MLLEKVTAYLDKTLVPFGSQQQVSRKQIAKALGLKNVTALRSVLTELETRRVIDKLGGHSVTFSAMTQLSGRTNTSNSADGAAEKEETGSKTQTAEPQERNSLENRPLPNNVRLACAKRDEVPVRATRQTETGPGEATFQCVKRQFAADLVRKYRETEKTHRRASVSAVVHILLSGQVFTSSVTDVEAAVHAKQSSWIRQKEVSAKLWQWQAREKILSQFSQILHFLSSEEGRDVLFPVLPQRSQSHVHSITEVQGAIRQYLSLLNQVQGTGIQEPSDIEFEEPSEDETGEAKEENANDPLANEHPEATAKTETEEGKEEGAGRGQKKKGRTWRSKFMERNAGSAQIMENVQKGEDAQVQETLLNSLSPAALETVVQQSIQQIEKSFVSALRANIDLKTAHFCNRYCQAGETVRECGTRLNAPEVEARYADVLAQNGQETCGSEKMLRSGLRVRGDDAAGVGGGGSEGGPEPELTLVSQGTAAEFRPYDPSVFQQVLGWIGSASKSLLAVLRTMWEFLRNFGQKLLSFVWTNSAALMFVQTLVRNQIPDVWRPVRRVRANVLRNEAVDYFLDLGDLSANVGSTFLDLIANGAGQPAKAEMQEFASIVENSADTAACQEDLFLACQKNPMFAVTVMQELFNLLATFSSALGRSVQQLCSMITSAVKIVSKLYFTGATLATATAGPAGVSLAAAAAGPVGVSLAAAGGVAAAAALASTEAAVQQFCVKAFSAAFFVAFSVSVYKMVKAVRAAQRDVQGPLQQGLLSAGKVTGMQLLAKVNNCVQLLNLHKWIPPKIEYVLPGWGTEWVSSVTLEDARTVTSRFAHAAFRNFFIGRAVVRDPLVRDLIKETKGHLLENKAAVLEGVTQSVSCCSDFAAKVTASAKVAAASPAMLTVAAVAAAVGISVLASWFLAKEANELEAKLVRLLRTSDPGGSVAAGAEDLSATKELAGCWQQAHIDFGMMQSAWSALTGQANDVFKVFQPCFGNTLEGTLELLHRYPAATSVGLPVKILLEKPVRATLESGSNETAVLEQAFQHIAGGQESGNLISQEGWTVDSVEVAGTSETAALLRVRHSASGKELKNVPARRLLPVSATLFSRGDLVHFNGGGTGRAGVYLVLGPSVAAGDAASRFWLLGGSNEPPPKEPSQGSSSESASPSLSGPQRRFTLSLAAVSDTVQVGRVPLEPGDVVAAFAESRHGIGDGGGGELAVLLQGGFAKTAAREDVSQTRCFLAFPVHFRPALDAFHRFCAVAQNARDDQTLSQTFMEVFSDGVAAMVGHRFREVLAELNPLGDDNASADLSGPGSLLTPETVAQRRLRFVASCLFSPKQEAWSEVAPLYTLRFVDDFLRPGILLDRLLEDSPGTVTFDKEAVRAQRAHELVSWKNNPFPTVPAPQLFWERRFLTSDESPHGGPKLRIRRMPALKVELSGNQVAPEGEKKQPQRGGKKVSGGRRARSKPSASAVFLYRYRDHLPCRLQTEHSGAQVDERPFFGIDGSQVPSAWKAVVHGRLAVDYTLLPSSVLCQLQEWQDKSFVVLPFVPGTGFTMAMPSQPPLSDAHDPVPSFSGGDRTTPKTGSRSRGSLGLWNEVRGARPCYRRAGPTARLLYHAKSHRFAFFSGSEAARTTEEVYWRKFFAQNPFANGFLCR
mmetsp:Transcript_21453/g.30289  ORF Transcript_21453/g.30289 Transcript_21453/m.30289 type:complete len:1645 (+) Transcript_21453:88-5022(+)